MINRGLPADPVFLDIDTLTGYLEGSTLHGTRNGEIIELYCAVHDDTVIVEYIIPDEKVQYLLFEKED